MSSTELLDTLLQANQDLHTSNEITAPPSMLKYIDVIVYRFHVTTHHPEYNGDTSLENYMIYTSFHNNPSAGYERTDMQIFGWSASYPLQVYTVMSDIRVGTSALLDLIQHIGQIYLRARFTPISLTTPITPTSYMTFSPLSNVYHAPNTPGY